jgi:hypothetical protein
MHRRRESTLVLALRITDAPTALPQGTIRLTGSETGVIPVEWPLNVRAQGAVPGLFECGDVLVLSPRDPAAPVPGRHRWTHVLVSSDAGGSLAIGQTRRVL